jgi:hypothetical protein
MMADERGNIPMSKAAAWSIVLVVMGLVGCGDSAPFSYVPVAGRVTYEDGTPIPASGMKLQFEPLDVQTVNGMHPRIATADLDAEGRFANATSHKYGDGLVPGKHKVAIGYATDKNGKLLIPKEDASLAETKLIIDTANLPLEIKVSKP